MLRVSYRNRIGYYTSTEQFPDMPVRKFKNWICHANCLWADMYFYKVAEDYEQFGKHYKKGDKMVQVLGFWTDRQHLKNALKNGAYRDVDTFHFYFDQMGTDIWAAVRLLAAAGKTVIIETKKTKKK